MLAEQFSVAFDVYNDILYHVDKLVNSALGRDTPNYRMLHTCAPCLYHLEGEPRLKHGLLGSIDGNSSLKLVDDTFRSGEARPDKRTWRTDLFITPEEVDQFKDEVRDAQQVCYGNVSTILTDVCLEICKPGLRSDHNSIEYAVRIRCCRQ